ncbi:MAG TPA: hypothetical protein VK447_20590, partial [Myxococcaceae bacterium]|nr:hypothetical protein [Myxococcaceae bacterium]
PVRDALTDYLQFVNAKMKLYRPIAPRLRAALARAGTRRIIDLCSGGGGPWGTLLGDLEQDSDLRYDVRLTDRYPNLPAFEQARAASGDRLEFEPESVDVTRVPERLEGFRTLFTSFHHFPPEVAREILADAVRKRQGIGIFEFTRRKVPDLLGMVASPLINLLVTPAIRPFRWSRLLWTYALPMVPGVVFWDGFVSCLRSYTPEELRAFADGLGDCGYDWEIGEEKVPASTFVLTYLIGVPRAGATTSGKA